MRTALHRALVGVIFVVGAVLVSAAFGGAR